MFRLRDQTVLIAGGVKHPGEYKIVGISDLQSVLNLAGGPLKSDEYVTVTCRGKDDFISEERFSLMALKGAKVYPGSIVDIRVGKIEPIESSPAGDFY
jgi:protein involved in polysaccharide export with SLBB domain